MEETADLVEAAQPNALLGRVDALCEARDWEGLIDLARRCMDAVERGKQLWPIAEHIDYRLALEGPASYAGRVLTPTAGRFALGPLTEVAASGHTFDELIPHIASPQAAGVVAAERVIRGEDLSGRSDAHPEVLELPMVLQSWEPVYILPSYRSDKLVLPSAELKPLSKAGVPSESDVIDDEEMTRSLLDLVEAWVASSNGVSQAVLVEGGADAAVSALGEESFQIDEIDPQTALALMAWAASSGGAHGRRRGAAAGRSGAWWAAAQLTEMEWPPDPHELGARIAELRWYRWEPNRPVGGWNLHLAVEDRVGGWSAALAAEDRADQDLT